MSFEKYTEVPINIVVTSESGMETTYFALAKDFNFDNSATLSPYRILGKATDSRQYTPTGNKEAKISMNLYVDPTIDSPALMCRMAQSDQGFTIKIGKTILNYCYVDSVSYSVVPFQPVIVSVTCSCYEVESLSLIPSTDLNSTLFNIGSGTKSEIILQGNSWSGDVLEAQVSINANREILYAPGSTVPMRSNLVSSELNCQMNVSHVGSFIDYKGADFTLAIAVVNDLGTACFDFSDIIVSENAQDGWDYLLKCVCSSQSLSVDEGGFVNGTMNFKAILV